MFCNAIIVLLHLFVILAHILFCLNADATVTLFNNHIHLYRELSLIIAQQVIKIDLTWRHIGFKIFLDCWQPIVIKIIVFKVFISINRHFIFPRRAHQLILNYFFIARYFDQMLCGI